MEILLLAATPYEIMPLRDWLDAHFKVSEQGVFQKNDLSVTVLVSGVGIAATSWHLGRYLAKTTPDLVLNAGIAGAFDTTLQLGDVVQVVSERFGDLGVEEADGRFTDLFELGLIDAAEKPYINGVLYNPGAAESHFLPQAKGLTVNKVHGNESSIAAIRSKYPDVQVETMEGAAFFQACLLAGVPFLQIRSISNYVEARNRERWQLAPAIENLNRTLVEMIGGLGGIVGDAD